MNKRLRYLAQRLLLTKKGEPRKQRNISAVLARLSREYHERGFWELFLADHPEWRNPHSDTVDYATWELEHREARQAAYEAWLEEQKK